MRQKLQKFFDEIDLKKKYPGYFNLWILRTGFILMFAFVCMDFVLNDYSFYAFSFECDAPEGQICRNILYDCAYVPIEKRFSPDTLCIDYNPTMRERICGSGVCELEFVPSGYHIGRSDIFARHGMFFVLLFPIAAFVVNGLVYRIKTGSWLPEKAK